MTESTTVQATAAPSGPGSTPACLEALEPDDEEDDGSQPPRAEPADEQDRRWPEMDARQGDRDRDQADRRQAQQRVGDRRRLPQVGQQSPGDGETEGDPHPDRQERSLRLGEAFGALLAPPAAPPNARPPTNAAMNPLPPMLTASR